MKKNKCLFLLFFNLFSYIVCILLSILKVNELALFLLVFSFFIELMYLKRTTKFYSNSIYIFVLFTVIYGLSRPISYFFENEYSLLTTAYDFSSWFISYSLSEIGIIVGLFFFYKPQSIVLNEKKSDILFLGKLSIFLMIIGATFQIINTFRVGGFDTLFLKKAIYQERESNLFLTLPSDTLILLSIACFSIYLSFAKRYSLKCISLALLLCAISSPYLVKILLLGQRGKIISIFIVLFLGVYYATPLKKIKAKVIVSLVVLYLLIVFIYTNRSIIPLLQTNKELFFERITDVSRYTNNLNSSEFTTSFNNFNTFIVSGNNDLKYGKSYIDGLAIMIPGFLYPGDKPVQLTYEFRDLYYSSLANTSRISSTGFSLILECYWNFGFWGIIPIFIFYTYIICYFECKFKSKTFLHYTLYAYLATTLVNFSRVQFGDWISKGLYGFVFFFIFVIIPYHFFRRKNYEKAN